jgi:murein peptide amidase A
LGWNQRREVLFRQWLWKRKNAQSCVALCARGRIEAPAAERVQRGANRTRKLRRREVAHLVYPFDALGGDPPNGAHFRGVHGDEPAGVHAALRFLADGQREFNDVLQFVVFPCVNPSGFDAGTLGTKSGANLNRLFGTGSTQPEVRAIENWLRVHARRFRMTFDLHETRPDYVGEGFVEKDNPRAAYLYETVTDDSDRIGRLMIDALPSGRMVCDWPTIYNDINQAGVISYPEACRNPIYARGTSFEGFLSRWYTGHAFTLETPTGWSLSDRVDTHLTFLKVALRHGMSSSTGVIPERDSPLR